jgi:glycine cleavage system pyridoxal-binding protein P
MKKLITLLPVAALLVACGTSDPYQKRAEYERERQEKYVERAIDKAPKWMTDIPISNSAVYEAGTAVSGDFSMADAKAKAAAYGKICMTAGGTASQRTKIYRTDSENTSTEFSEQAIRASCKEVDLTGVEVKEIKRIAEGPRFRTYVLVALPTGDANILRKAKEAARQREIALKRAPEAFKELDQ